MAHALGWDRRSWRNRWVRPWRNYFFTKADNETWTRLVGKGLAKRGPRLECGGAYFGVTSRGIVVLRLRVHAELEAGRLDVSGVAR